MNILASPLNSSTLQLGWNAPPAQLHNGLIVDYSVNVSEVETGNSFQLVTGGLTNIVVPGLQPYYTYVFVIAALTIVGHGPYSTSSSIQMPEDGECCFGFLSTHLTTVLCYSPYFIPTRTNWRCLELHCNTA